MRSGARAQLGEHRPLSPGKRGFGRCPAWRLRPVTRSLIRAVGFGFSDGVEGIIVSAFFCFYVLGVNGEGWEEDVRSTNE